MRQLTVKYEGECKRCNKILEINEVVMYEKSMGLFCIGHEPIEVEDIRYFRTLKAKKKAEKLLNKANRLDKEANRRMKPLDEASKDWAFVTQPGHIPARAKMIKSFDKGIELAKEADKARDKADNILIYKTRVKGDADRNRERVREMNDQILSKGSRIFDAIFGNGEIIKVNKNTYTVKFDRGFNQKIDKSFARLLEGENK